MGCVLCFPYVGDHRDLPDELVERLRKRPERLAEIVELGLRELDAAGRSSFEGAAAVLEFLAGLPSPEETLALVPSPRLHERIKQLLEKNRTGRLSAQEEEEWERYQYLEHLVRTAKTKACLKLGIEPGSNA